MKYRVLFYRDEVNPVLRVSYMWYTLAGLSVTICIGAIVSRINRARGVPFVPPSPALLAPQLRRLYKEPPHPSEELFIRAYGPNKVSFLNHELFTNVKHLNFYINCI